MKRSVYLLLLILIGCNSNEPETLVRVKLSDSNHTILISGFDKAIIDDIGRDTTSGVWQNLLPVYKMPADTDMKDFQQAQPGRYSIQGSNVVFTPDTPFRKGQAYFLRCFDRAGVKSAWQLVRGGKRPGTSKYRDLLFSY